MPLQSIFHEMEWGEMNAEKHEELTAKIATFQQSSAKPQRLFQPLQTLDARSPAASGSVLHEVFQTI